MISHPGEYMLIYNVHTCMYVSIVLCKSRHIKLHLSLVHFSVHNF